VLSQPLQGAAGPDEGPTPASDALVEALKEGPLTVLALGPVSNVAQAVKSRPDLAQRLKVVAVAGRLPGQRFTTGTTNLRGHRDFNFEQDPQAMAYLIERGISLTLAPFELSRKVWITVPYLDRLEAQAPDTAPLIAPARAWLQLWHDTFQVDGFNPFDTLAVGVLTRRDLITCDPLGVRIAEHPDDRDRVELEVLRPSRELFGAYGGLVRGVTAVAPLTGLLGTVSGMIETFDSLASMELFSAGGGGIGAGISSAMISTQMGLVVAVPGILLGAALQRRQRALEDQLEQMA